MGTISKIVESELMTDIRQANSESRIENLFAFYVTNLCQNGLVWIVKANEEVAVASV